MATNSTTQERTAPELKQEQVDKDLKEKIIGIKRLGDIVIKLALEEDIIHTISVYAPKVGLDKSVNRQFWDETDKKKRQFWDEIDCLMQEISNSEKSFLGGDLNGNVGKDSRGRQGGMSLKTLPWNLHWHLLL